MVVLSYPLGADNGLQSGNAGVADRAALHGSDPILSSYVCQVRSVPPLPSNQLSFLEMFYKVYKSENVTAVNSFYCFIFLYSSPDHSRHGPERPHQSLSHRLQEHPHHNQHGVSELVQRLGLAEEKARRRRRLRRLVTLCINHSSVSSTPDQLVNIRSVGFGFAATTSF